MIYLYYIVCCLASLYTDICKCILLQIFCRKNQMRIFAKNAAHYLLHLQFLRRDLQDASPDEPAQDQRSFSGLLPAPELPTQTCMWEVS